MQERSVDGVRLERTGWRDEALSSRHRTWGYDCPAVDVDFLLVEFNKGLPAALVDYKHVGAMMPSFTPPSMRAICALADAAAIPFMVVFYDTRPAWWFSVYPVNSSAGKQFQRGQLMSEREFVETLYRLRGIKASPFQLQRYGTYKPQRS